MTDFASNLVKCDPRVLEKGDFVYELVRFGMSERDVKYNKFRVVSVERGAVNVVGVDGSKASRAIKLSTTKLLMERPVVAAARALPDVVVGRASPEPGKREVPVSKAAPSAPKHDDQFQAWLEMGRELVATLDTEERALNEQKAKLERDLEAIDATHRRRIEALDAELAAARKAHDSDRALAAEGRDLIDAKLAGLAERKAGLQKMLGGG